MQSRSLDVACRSLPTAVAVDVPVAVTIVTSFSAVAVTTLIAEAVAVDVLAHLQSSPAACAFFRDLHQGSAKIEQSKWEKIIWPLH